MTMKIYAKVRAGTKRQALGRLSYGAGVKTPEHVMELSATREGELSGDRVSASKIDKTELKAI
jgi:hypothetical protein